MAQVKKFVVKSINRGENIKDILTDAVKKDEFTKWDVVKTFLWWAWFKLANSRISNFLWNYVVRVCGIALAILMMLITFCVSIVILTTVGLLSPMWYSLMIWLAPQKAISLIFNEREGEEKRWWLIFDLPYSLASNIVFVWVMMPFFWGWVWNRMPMSRRQHYINARGKELKSYDLQTQIEYYDVKSNSKAKVDAIQRMSRESMRQIWNRGKIADRENILKVYTLGKEDGMLLLNGDNEMFNFLACLCADKEKNLITKLQLAFVEMLEKGKGENNGSNSSIEKAIEEITGLNKIQSRAYDILKVCCNNRTLDDETIIALINLLGSNVSEQAKELLLLYWSKNTFSNEIDKVLVESSTSDFADEKKNLSYELLLQTVKRNGITPENAELFFNRCNDAQNDEMDKLIKMHMDCQIIDWQCIDETSQEHYNKLKQYFGLREFIDPEAQRWLREWQYRLFRDTNHKLDEEVLNEFLTKKLKEKDISYFKAVLAEGIERNVITDTTNKLMLMVPWKRQIVLDTMEATEKNKGYVVL